MGIDRRSLSKINRKLATGLDTDEKWRMVRVPASEDVWLAWKLYCEKANVSMGRALSALIENELRSLTGGDIEGPVRVVDVERVLRDREAELVARERRVRALERNIRGRERRLAAGNRGSGPGGPVLPVVGRNEPCPCGSGLKYKRCHGMPA